MARILGTFAIRRPQRLNAPILAMLMNAVHDRSAGRVFVLQIGAGDGTAPADLLQRFTSDTWSGLLIEPHPAHFAALETLHADSDRVAVLNLGISDVSASFPLFSLTPEAAARNPKLAANRASLIRDRILGPGLTEDDLTSVEVPFLRMDSVLRELGIDSAQLVVLNAGGHEPQVLRSFDLAALAPTVALVRSTPDTPQDTAILAALTEANLTPYRVGGWLAGLTAGLSVPLDDLLTFFNRGIGQTEVEE
jgi:FkbM family methyltransferase